MDRNDRSKMDAAMRTILGASQQIQPNINMLLESMKQLEGGLMQIAQDQHALATSIDACRLTQHMMFRMLIEKNLFTQEELEQRYQLEVVAPMRKMQEEIIEKMKAAQEAASKLVETVPGPSTEEVVEEPTDSTVVLPSERSNVVTFPGSSK